MKIGGKVELHIVFNDDEDKWKVWSDNPEIEVWNYTLASAFEAFGSEWAKEILSNQIGRTNYETEYREEKGGKK